MSVLPSPIPHPLEFSPFDVPGWAYEALEWVVGFDWPAGNEVTTWDVADRWYVLAKDLAEPQEATFEAAARVLDGYGGAGITADGFRNAFQQLAGDDDAPLNGLLHIADGLGQLVEGCGRDLEGAKLEAWIEIGIFLTELIGMAITVALTFGAASPAAGGLIMTTRMAIQQIFKRLVEQLGKKALKSTAKHAIKEMTTKEGLAKLGKKALHEGLEEAREEFATNGGIQLYQESTGRSRGFSFTDLGLSAVGGFAGGAAATGSELGAHGHHGGLARGAGGEVLAEFGASAAFGDLAGLENVAKAGASGASGSAIHGAASTIDVSSLQVGKGPLDLGVSSQGSPVDGLSGSGLSAAPSIDAPSGDTAWDGASNLTAHGTTSNDADLNGGAPTGASSNGGSLNGGNSTDAGLNGTSTTAPSADGSATTPSPAAQANVSPGLSAAASVDRPSTSLAPGPSAAGTSPAVSITGTADATPSSANLSDISLSSPATSTAPPNPALTSTTSPSTDQAFTNPTPVVVTPGAATPGAATRGAATRGAATPGASTTRRRPLSDLDRIAAALGPAKPRAAALGPAKPRAASSTTVPRQRSSSPRIPTRSLADPIRNEAGYFGYAHHARRTHELNRRDEYVNYLTSIAEESRAKILSLGHEADLAFRAGLTLRGEDHRRRATEFSVIVDEIETQIDQVRTGRLAPAKVEVGPQDWARINTDVGNLAPGGIHTDDLSAVTGTLGRLPIDRTRRYNSVGGLRAPLAVHQTDLEDAVPRAGDGRPQRLPDPRTGNWFRLANDGGPQLDPTRGLNCVDGVLALFDTYIHGRPRVSAPRTFDTYAHGNPDRPLGGETDGIRRIQEATGTTFQNLCPYVGSVSPTAAKPAIDLALRNLTNHLLNTGHGAYAFIVTDIEAGGSHAWAATNHHGTILFLDPQIGRVTENTSPYTHRGIRTNTNITSMDALVVDANGTPAPLPRHGPGQRSAAPTGTNNESPTQRDERLALQSFEPDDLLSLEASVEQAQRVAVEVSDDLHRIVADLTHGSGDDQPRVVDEERRVKSLGSLARKVSGRVEVRGQSVATALANIKDRVRFSIQVPEAQYGQTVRQVLNALQSIGYRDIVIENFWGACGRHNGLNVNVTSADGFVFEIQFPTPLSRRVGGYTHVAYEAVRFDRNSIGARVDAFLDIVTINRDKGIYDRVPHGLDLLLGPPFEASSVDTSLAAWLQKDGRLPAYRRYLAQSGLTFEQVLRNHNLDVDDLPGMRELI